nr:unnamed protein product [Haemonchus contortus]
MFIIVTYVGAHAVVKIRLPVAPCCSGSNVRQLRRTSLAQFEVDLSDVESGLHEVMDLIDEMISFLTKEESHEATFCCTKRSFIRETSEKASQVRDRHKELERAFLARRSRARVLLEDDFHSVLRSAKLVPNGTVGLDDNVFTFPSEHRHKSLSFPDALASNILPYNCHFSLLQSFDGSPTIEMDDSMIDEELSIRVQHISQRLDGQMAIEENVLRSFKLLHSLYDREYRRDDRRGIESCDSETLSTDRRFRSLRFMLALPPSKLSPNRKLDFGDHCDSIINCPEGSDMNQHMLGISPFWKTAKTNAIRKSWRCTRAGRIMRDSQRFGYFPSYLLRDDYKEYYVEDLIDHCNQTRYRIDYNRMEQIWSHLERNVFAYKHHLAQNRRRLEGSRKNAELFKENLPVCLSCTQVEAEKFSEDNDVLRSEMEDFTNEGVSAREILATAFRAIHQTTVIMIQTRDAILELVHSILEGRENAAQQTDSVYDEELFTRQMEQTLQQSFEEIQSSSKMQH